MSAEPAIENELSLTADRSSESTDEAQDLDRSDVESVLSGAALSHCSYTDLSLFGDDDESISTGTFEPETEVALKFDLHSSLTKLSQWSGGQSEVSDSDLGVYDPSRVLEYFFRYILHILIALGHSSSHAYGSRLG